LEALRSRAVEARVLQPEFGRFEVFSGRRNVMYLPLDLEQHWVPSDNNKRSNVAAVEPSMRSLLVSGHHGFKLSAITVSGSLSTRVGVQ